MTNFPKKQTDQIIHKLTAKHDHAADSIYYIPLMYVSYPAWNNFLKKYLPSNIQSEIKNRYLTTTIFIFSEYFIINFGTIVQIELLHP